MEYADRDLPELKRAYAEREGIQPLEDAIKEIANELDLLYDALAPVLKPERDDVLREALPPGLSPLAIQVNRLRETRMRLTEHVQRLDI